MLGIQDIDNIQPRIESNSKIENNNPKAKSKQNEKSQIKKIWSFILTILFLLILFSFIFWLRGSQLKNKNSNEIVKSNQTGVLINFIRNENGTVLFVIQQNNIMSINVQLNGEVNWRNISKDDETAKNPDLSLSGDYVAYLSEKGKNHIEVVPLKNEKSLLKLIINKLEPDSKNIVLPENIGICSWTTIKWSPNNKFIAFFIKDLNSNHSFAVVVDLFSGKIIWKESYSEKQENRQLSWLESNQLLITHLDENRIYLDSLNVTTKK